jgi:hypothetical protein
MIRLLDNGLRGKQRVTKDKIGQVRVIQSHGTQEKCLFLSPGSQGHPAVIFDRYSRHGFSSPKGLYTFK